MTWHLPLIAKNARLSIQNPRKRTYFVGELMPKCEWNRDWMNHVQYFQPVYSYSEKKGNRWINRTITCSFSMESINEVTVQSIIIIGRLSAGVKTL